MDKQLLNEIHAAYNRLEQKQVAIVRALFHRNPDLESGWYNGHYHRGDNGNWFRESYPIPVISVKDLCDFEIHFDEITVSAKLRRDTALAYPYEKFFGYNFEVYSAEDFLTDFWHTGQPVQELRESICTCTEKELAFSFKFPFDTEES